MFDQATKVIARFGNARDLARAIGINPVSVYRWTYPRSKGGSDGVIPGASVPHIVKAARQAGILLRESDWIPERVVPQLPAELE